MRPASSLLNANIPAEANRSVFLSQRPCIKPWHKIWKVRSSGGPKIQITRDGSSLATESADGKFLYMIHEGEDIGGLFRTQMDGSRPRKF